MVKTEVAGGRTKAEAHCSRQPYPLQQQPQHKYNSLLGSVRHTTSRPDVKISCDKPPPRSTTLVYALSVTHTGTYHISNHLKADISEGLKGKPRSRILPKKSVSNARCSLLPSQQAEHSASASGTADSMHYFSRGCCCQLSANVRVHPSLHDSVVLGIYVH